MSCLLTGELFLFVQDRMFGEMVVIEELLQGEELSVCDQWCGYVLLFFALLLCSMYKHTSLLFQIVGFFGLDALT